MTELTTKHCKEVLEQELLIGLDKACDGQTKRFKFHVWDNEYRVTHAGKLIDSGQAIEELLNIYNDL